VVLLRVAQPTRRQATARLRQVLLVARLELLALKPPVVLSRAAITRQAGTQPVLPLRAAILLALVALMPPLARRVDIPVSPRPVPLVLLELVALKPPPALRADTPAKLALLLRAAITRFSSSNRVSGADPSSSRAPTAVLRPVPLAAPRADIPLALVVLRALPIPSRAATPRVDPPQVPLCSCSLSFSL
jgi:hypothetical protein